ncbi:MAG: NAD(P)H-hydrate dehydratase [Flavobacteriales bacterium]
MKLFTLEQIKDWDRQTIQNHYNAPQDLIDHVAHACSDRILEYSFGEQFAIFCGIGNNGADGIALGLRLHAENMKVTLILVGKPEKGTEAFRHFLQLAIDHDVAITFTHEDDVIEIDHEMCIIDCLLGVGINRPVEGWMASVISFINQLPNQKISIDIPSGLHPDDWSPQHGTILHADLTLTLETPKRCMMTRENADFIGEFDIVPIQLDADFAISEPCDVIYYNHFSAIQDSKFRNKFDHKNVFGHLQFIGGSMHTMGAVGLGVYAAMRSGVGLTTAWIPACGLTFLQSFVPEAMCVTDQHHSHIVEMPIIPKCTAVVVGPGIGQHDETKSALFQLLETIDRPVLFDADALNMIASDNKLESLPVGSIITPHVGEFDRLFGLHETTAERIETAKRIAADQKIVIVLKGAHTIVVAPDESLSFNASGNAGMATAGSGDVLSGIIGALLAQGYHPATAARLGAYLHGAAGDAAASVKGMECLIARDIIENLHKTMVRMQ